MTYATIITTQELLHPVQSRRPISLKRRIRLWQAQQRRRSAAPSV